MHEARSAVSRDVAAGVHGDQELVALARLGPAGSVYRAAYRPLAGAALAAAVVRSATGLSSADLRRIASVGARTVADADELARAVHDHPSCTAGALVELLHACHGPLGEEEFGEAAAAVGALGRHGLIAAAVAQASCRVLQPTAHAVAVAVADEIDACDDEAFVATAVCLLAEADQDMATVLTAARSCTT